MGWMTPSCLIDSASSVRVSSGKVRRGCWGSGVMASRRRASSCRPEACSTSSWALKSASNALDLDGIGWERLIVGFFFQLRFLRSKRPRVCRNDNMHQRLGHGYRIYLRPIPAENSNQMQEQRNGKCAKECAPGIIRSHGRLKGYLTAAQVRTRSADGDILSQFN